MKDERPSLIAFTPRECGMLAGLADVWKSNPYPPGRNVPNHDHDEWQAGFHEGLAIRDATIDKEYDGD